jgi:hypothetical protein
MRTHIGPLRLTRYQKPYSTVLFCCLCGPLAAASSGNYPYQMDDGGAYFNLAARLEVFRRRAIMKNKSKISNANRQ